MRSSVLYFVTGNKGKVTSPKRVLAQYGIELRQYEPKPDLLELQAEDAAGVAVPKAFEAAARLRTEFGAQPALMVIDSALHIPTLRNFPGVYTKHVTGQIGIEGYLDLLARFPNDADRACYYEDVIAYLAPNAEKALLFARQDWGTVARERRGTFVEGKHKSVFVELFQPRGYDLTLAEMTDAELHAYRTKPGTEGFYHALGAHISGKLRLDLSPQSRNV